MDEKVIGLKMRISGGRGGGGRRGGRRGRRSRGPGAFFGAFHAILRAADTAFLDAGGVQGPAHNVVADPRQVFHTPAAHQDNGVFLKIVAFIRGGTSRS